jgi:CubicO group peptidase (beta-lactamase class C family)
MKTITLLHIFALIALNTQAQDVYKIDSLFTQLANEKEFNGNVLILKDDTIIYEKSMGFADYEEHIKLDKESVFELASIGKLYTAVCIGILKDQGKVKFDDLVQNYIVDFPFPEITIRHLLNHTSGLPEYIDYFTHNAEEGERFYNQDVLLFLQSKDTHLEFNPGDSIIYSNTGYVVLASIVEKVSGYSFDAFLEKFVFNPLDIDHSIAFTLKFNNLVSVNNYAFGHQLGPDNKPIPINKRIETKDIYKYGLRPIQGDGNIVGQIRDYAEFIKALRNNELLKKETFEDFLTPGKLNSGIHTDYGFGVYLSEDGNEYYHTRTRTCNNYE